MGQKNLSIAITGAGGAGVISCGELLLQAWGSAGGRGLLRKAFGPQIRGGESAALLKLTDAERYTAAERYDVLVALDWSNYARFEDEIRLTEQTLVICEEKKPVPDEISSVTTNIVPISFAATAKSTHQDGRVNMLALGLLGQLLMLPIDSLCQFADQKLSKKPAAYRKAAELCIKQGAALDVDCKLDVPARQAGDSWYISGNQGAGLAALEAGIRFVAAYPITPASDTLEWLAGGLEAVGGQLLQAEDELAAINMCLGAAYGGVPAFTATSGPGLALMTESIGLAIASETPVTILNVQRGGPSTGIPTKSEQSDLNIALYGMHGDAPHLVLAPLDIADCVYTTGWSVKLAQHLQTAAIVLSDQFIGQSTAIISEPERCTLELAENSDIGENYRRYQLTENGVSALAVPGDPECRFTADGLEHNEKGTPSAKNSDHRQQLDKRLHKLQSFDFGDSWGRVSGEGAIALLGFGSSAAAMEEAAELLSAKGIAVRVIALRLLAPLPVAQLQAALSGCEQVVVVEQNHSKQLYQYLRAQMDFSPNLVSYAVPGPVPLSPSQIANMIAEEVN